MHFCHSGDQERSRSRSQQNLKSAAGRKAGGKPLEVANRHGVRGGRSGGFRAGEGPKKTGDKAHYFLPIPLRDGWNRGVSRGQSAHVPSPSTPAPGFFINL